ncbi:MAG: response regulator transcription factor [Bacteroidota bacterium]
MKKVKCMIVDDEPLAIQLIENHISKIDQLEVVATCNNPIDAFGLLKEHSIELLFLDIKMSDMSGLDFLKTLKDPPETIFTTAHREFALESYDLQALDYLLKPITFHRFYKAVDRYLSSANAQAETKSSSNLEESFILMRAGSIHHKIFEREIMFIESNKDYITIHKNDGEKITSKYRISLIESELSSNDFLRVHRSFIINTQLIKAFSAHDIHVGDHEIPIGASYKESTVAFLKSMKK